MSAKKCFVIAPIGEETSAERKRVETIIRDVLKPTLGDNYQVFAAHHIKKPGIITSQIVEMIFESDLVIADLTNVNGNVMYELAIAHLKEKQVLIIANKDTKLPFDISHNRVIFYEDNISGSFSLKKEIEEAIKRIEKEPSVENPISVVLKKSKTTLRTEDFIKNTIREAIDDIFIDKRAQRKNEIKINWPKTDQIIHNYLRKDERFNEGSFHNSVCASIEKLRFPIHISNLKKSVIVSDSENSITFDYLLVSNSKIYLIKIASTIFRISHQSVGIQIVKIIGNLEEVEGHPKNIVQPIVIVPMEMPKAGKLLSKKIPLLKYNTLKSEFTNWEVVVHDFGKFSNIDFSKNNLKEQNSRDKTVLQNDKLQGLKVVGKINLSDLEKKPQNPKRDFK
jgi:hypothetical protein